MTDDIKRTPLRERYAGLSVGAQMELDKYDSEFIADAENAREPAESLVRKYNEELSASIKAGPQHN